VSQYVRGVRPPSAETTLYWGLHSSFSLGQVALGTLGLWLASRDADAVRHPVMLAVSIAAATGWLLIAVYFTEYVPPRFNAAVFGLLAVAVAVTR